MIEPEDEIAAGNEDNENPRNVSNSQENPETVESDLSGYDTSVPEDDEPDTDRWDLATEASTPSFTLEPEKGLTPDPKDTNPPEAQDGYNVKQ